MNGTNNLMEWPAGSFFSRALRMASITGPLLQPDDTKAALAAAPKGFMHRSK